MMGDDCVSQRRNDEIVTLETFWTHYRNTLDNGFGYLTIDNECGWTLDESYNRPPDFRQPSMPWA